MPNSLIINLEGRDEGTEGRKKHLLSYTVVPSFPRSPIVPARHLPTRALQWRTDEAGVSEAN